MVCCDNFDWLILFVGNFSLILNIDWFMFVGLLIVIGFVLVLIGWYFFLIECLNLVF